MITKASTFRVAPYRKTVSDAPVSYSVYSAFSFYGARRGHELPGTWLVSALGALGHGVAAVRQTLYRMEASRELESRIAGRAKFYSLTPGARAESGAGLAKIMEDDVAVWDGQWTLVQMAPGAEDRIERERLREVLRAEGFAAVGAGLYIHPRDRSARVIAAANGHGVRDIIEVFRGTRVPGRTDREFVMAHWDLETLASAYAAFLAKYVELRKVRTAFTPEVSFVVRFAVVFDYLEIGWRDPGLISALLPDNWPGTRAKQLARELYERFLPGAMEFGDSLRGV